MKKININLYPTKWNSLVDEHGKEAAEILYWKFCRVFSLEKYMLKYGQEEGEKLFHEKKSKISRGTTLNKMIEKYGEKDGAEKYSSWKKSVAGTLENFISRHGEQQGKEKYAVFQQKSKDAVLNARLDPNSTYNKRTITVSLDYWTSVANGDKELGKLLLAERQNTSSLEKMVKRHGEQDGIIKYQEANKRKIQSLENFVKLYGPAVGVEKYDRMKARLSYAHTSERYCELYGEIEGLKKYKEIISKRTSWMLNAPPTSNIANEFCELLSKHFQEHKCYFGDNEYKFFVHTDGFKIIMPDFYIKDLNVAIEFYGDYWHRNPVKFLDEDSASVRERDVRRLEALKHKFNCSCFVIWETDYRKNKELAISSVVDYVSSIKKEKENGNC